MRWFARWNESGQRPREGEVSIGELMMIDEL